MATWQAKFANSGDIACFGALPDRSFFLVRVLEDKGAGCDLGNQKIDATGIKFISSHLSVSANRIISCSYVAKAGGRPSCCCIGTMFRRRDPAAWLMLSRFSCARCVWSPCGWLQANATLTRVWI